MPRTNTALVVGASFFHHAQGGGIWPDGAGMPDRQPMMRPLVVSIRSGNDRVMLLSVSALSSLLVLGC